jgi:hypothetical protein
VAKLIECGVALLGVWHIAKRRCGEANGMWRSFVGCVA